MGWVEVDEATQDALAITWDECHKIYLVMDQGQIRDFIEYGYELTTGHPSDLQKKLRDWYDDSCDLRFISAVSTNKDDPNLGFVQCIEQGEVV